MRRGDYPSGESLGVKAANKENIVKAIENKANRNKTAIKAAILFLKDSGLRISDARLFNYGDMKEQLERGDEFIEVARITQKQKTIAKPFIGPEAIHALKTYLQEREQGSRRVPPEKLTDTSPLFRTWESTKIQRIQRNSFSSLIRQTFLRINEQHTTAHSLRKYLQTNLEAAGINANWIDQILGHKLINSRDAYSKPTDEQLREAYINAYKFIQVYPDLDTPRPQTNTQPVVNKSMKPIQEFQFTVTIEGKEYKS
jgi:site-specific recombinase XerD